jgi:hypothetical protein
MFMQHLKGKSNKGQKDRATTVEEESSSSDEELGVVRITRGATKKAASKGGRKASKK